MRFQSRKKVLVDQSYLTLFNPVVCPWNFLGKNTGVGCHFLLQEIFSTQGLKLYLLLGRPILYHWATLAKYNRGEKSNFGPTSHPW